jgi:hypothetical protein
MAQESRITSFEKALKDEGIAGTNLEPVARSIFQQESSSGANVKTSNAGARGPMQVLPATFKAYNPQGNIDDPYDNSVGGLRYIKDLFSKTNDPGLTAIGYYGGPKAIEKAKQGIAVSDPRNPNAPNTLQYMEQVMGRTKGSQPQPTPRGNKPPVNPLIKQKITDLGPSYQAALALMAKADDLSEAREKIAEEEELASAGADFSQAKQMLAQIKPTSPFPAQEPRRMAEGGLASAYAGRNPRISSKDKTKQDEMNKSIKEYETKVDEYNKAVAAHNKMLETFEPGNRFRPGPRTPPEFTLKAPTAPMTQAEIDKFTEQVKQRAIQNAQSSSTAMRAVQAPSQFNIGSFGLGDVSGFAGTSTPLFAEGGEVEKKPEPSMGEKVKGTAKEILRSTQYTPYDLLGAPVDIINLGLKGVDYVTGSKLATEKPVGGSDYLIQKSRELGIADKPTGSTTETLTRLGTGIISPTAGPRAVVAAGQAVKGTAKAALEDLAMASTGQGGSNLAQKIMAPGTAFAVRPKGGVYLGAKSMDEPPLSNFDIDVRRLAEGLDKTDPKEAEILGFFDKKVRNYVMNQQGTVDDPIFKKLFSGEIPNFTYASEADIAAARAGDKAALKHVRDAYDASLSLSGYIRAGKNKDLYSAEQILKKRIEEQSPENYLTSALTSVNPMSAEEVAKYPSLYAAPGFSSFAKEAQSQGPLAQLLNRSDLPPHIRRAIAEGEPVLTSTKYGMGRGVDMRELRDYLLTRTPNEIKNMGVADAAAKSAEWHEMLAKAATSPNKFSKKQLFAGTEPVMKTGDEFSWVDVKTREALTIEGCIMGHCVGKMPSYAEGVLNGTKKIYSLRDQKGIPHVTMELTKPDPWRFFSENPPDPKTLKFNQIAQVKGKADKPAEKYFPQINEFLTDYSSKVGEPVKITEDPRFLPENWRNK